MNQEDSYLASLPLELVHRISRFLAPADIVKLSQTCRWLRAALNHDDVWNRYLPDGHTYLEETEQMVKPRLEIHTAVPALCSNQLHLIRKTRLLNNWKQLNLVESPSVSLPCNDVCSAKLLREKGCQALYRDRYIFFAGLKEGEGGVHSLVCALDINVTPTIVTYMRLEGPCSWFHVADDYFVIIIRLVVCVYRINFSELQLPLEYSFFIPEERVTFGEKANNPREPTGEWDHFFSGNYLMSTFCHSGNAFLHLWDVVKVIKVGLFASPIPEVKSLTFISEYKNYLIFRQEQTTQLLPNNNTSEQMFLLFFDLDKRQFAQFACEFADTVLHIMFHDERVILLKASCMNYTECFVWTLDRTSDPETSLDVNIQTLNGFEANAYRLFGKECWSYLPETVVVNGKFIIYDKGLFLVLDAASLETVDSIELGYFPVQITNEFHVFMSLFATLICGLEKINRKRWNVCNYERTCQDLQVAGDVYINLSCTKMVVCEKSHVKVLHFGAGKELVPPYSDFGLSGFDLFRAGLNCSLM